MDNGALVERGRVISANDGLYAIRSLTRDGIITPGIPALDGNTYKADDTVYFFIFPDGHGGIIAAFE